MTRFRKVLLGESDLSHRFLLSALSLAVLVFLFIGAWNTIYSRPLPLTGEQFYILLASVMLLASAIGGFFDSGLILSVALAVAPPLGFFESRAVFNLVGPVQPTLVTAFGQALMYGVPIGLLGFVVGCVLKRIYRVT